MIYEREKRVESPRSGVAQGPFAAFPSHLLLQPTLIYTVHGTQTTSHRTSRVVFPAFPASCYSPIVTIDGHAPVETCQSYGLSKSRLAKFGENRMMPLGRDMDITAHSAPVAHHLHHETTSHTPSLADHTWSLTTRCACLKQGDLNPSPCSSVPLPIHDVRNPSKAWALLAATQA